MNRTPVLANHHSFLSLLFARAFKHSHPAAEVLTRAVIAQLIQYQGQVSTSTVPLSYLQCTPGAIFASFDSSVCSVRPYLLEPPKLPCLHRSAYSAAYYAHTLCLICSFVMVQAKWSRPQTSSVCPVSRAPIRLESVHQPARPAPSALMQPALVCMHCSLDCETRVVVFSCRCRKCHCLFGASIRLPEAHSFTPACIVSWPRFLRLRRPALHPPRLMSS